MANTSSAKGNPASHRMSNTALKARRQASWNRGEDRKKARREDQKIRELANRERPSNELTAWQHAKYMRAQRRNSEPRVLRARRLHMADALAMPTEADPRNGR